MKRTKCLLFFVLLVMLACLLGGCAQTSASAPTQYNSLEDLAGKRIGVVSGAMFDQIAKKNIPDCNVQYFNSNADLCAALNSGKIDAFLVDEPVARKLTAKYSTQRILGKMIDDQYGFIFPKNDAGQKLGEQMNEFLEKIRKEGILQEIDTIWFGMEESKQTVDTTGLTAENGTLTVAINSSLGEPFIYLKNEKPVGYEVDIVVRFARAYGYGISFVDSNFIGVIASISSGKANIGVASISITDERKKSMNFSEPHYTGGISVVVAQADTAGESGGSSLRANFEKTFLLEERWKLFVEGIGVTVLITVLSTLFGTLLGFILYMFYRKNFKPLNVLIRILMDIFEKTPVVVILMIMYYIFFGRSSLEGIWVSVISFTVMFAFSFVKTVNVGVNAVDKGQTEASLALGFTDTRSFIRVVLPQAAKHFLPVYRGQIVVLLKDTAVVGYIAVQDLTRVSDIIRGGTYEAFFPLIVTAVIYFLMAWLLTLIIERIEFHTIPSGRSRKKITKGIKTK